MSVIGLKSYQRGRESFQGETLDYLWFDEEPPADIFTEGLTRTNVNQGPVWVTFTPLLGMSETVRRFLLEPSPDRSVTTMTIDDVGHFTMRRIDRPSTCWLPLCRNRQACLASSLDSIPHKRASATGDLV